MNAAQAANVFVRKDAATQQTVRIGVDILCRHRNQTEERLRVFNRMAVQIVIELDQPEAAHHPVPSDREVELSVLDELRNLLIDIGGYDRNVVASGLVHSKLAAKSCDGTKYDDRIDFTGCEARNELFGRTFGRSRD